MMNDLKLSELNQELSDKSIDERLEKLAILFKGEIIFTTSFGIEDQVITHKIFSNNLDIKVVTLDTGRLFPETYEVFARTMIRYNKKINVYFPDNQDVEDMVTKKGPLSFYNSLDDRMECCRIRKVVPLNRALAGMKCWISGIRSSQSDNRNSMDDLEYDDEKGLYKYHPLFNWSFKEVEQYISEMQIPYNTLHDKGFLSIGCQPCTRAVQEGEDFRAGRWWWEKEGPKECGCHIKE
jgi:phosphoadenosine phosphosulfate reductase